MKGPIVTNLELLKRSKSPPIAGDIFVFKPALWQYYFGRVIDPKIKLLSWDGVLAYVYDAHSPDSRDIPILRKEKLLLPPLILDPICWRRGYVETVVSAALTADDVLPQHCFFDVVTKQYVDECRVPLSMRIEPCGIYGLTPFRGFDDKVSKVLGIKPAP